MAQIEEARRAAGDWPILDALTGAVRHQTGKYEQALELFRAAVAKMEAAGERRFAVMGIGETGLLHLIREEREAARSNLRRTVELARAMAWNAYLPYPEALLGILDVWEGDLPSAQERLEHAFALGCQIRDCCWEGISAAGLALWGEARGNARAAIDRFEDARRRSVREPDAWLWAHAFVLDLACAFAIRHGLGQAGSWVGDLESLSARTMMKEFLACAYLYRHTLGEAGALRAAELIASEVENPALHRRLLEVAGRGGTVGAS